MLLSCGQPKSSNEAVKKALERMKAALAHAETNLQKAQERMKQAVNKRMWSETYTASDKMVLTIANLCSYWPHLPPKVKPR